MRESRYTYFHVNPLYRCFIEVFSTYPQLWRVFYYDEQVMCCSLTLNLSIQEFYYIVNPFLKEIYRYFYDIGAENEIRSGISLFLHYSAFLPLYSPSEWMDGYFHTVKALGRVTKRERSCFDYV